MFGHKKINFTEKLISKYQLLSDSFFQLFPKIEPHLLHELEYQFKLLIQSDTANDYNKIYESSPNLKADIFSTEGDKIYFSSKNILSEEKKKVQDLLKQFIPWRKGPFSIFDVDIDAEWKSHYKWKRIQPYLQNIQDKIICDIGCNNGYYMYKLYTHKPKAIIGLDPVVKYYYQFLIFQKWRMISNMYFLPFGFEILHYFKKQFDMILCMGILYHHQDPIKILQQAHIALKPKGKILIESLVISSKEPFCLSPGKTYLGAKGMWFIPSESCLVNWLRKCNFSNIKVFYNQKMELDEQVKTTWAPYYAYKEHVDSNNLKTNEGFETPNRICLIADKI